MTITNPIPQLKVLSISSLLILPISANQINFSGEKKFLASIFTWKSSGNARSIFSDKPPSSNMRH